MRNIEVAIALLFGYFIAWLTRHHGAKYVTNDNIDISDSITFLWRHWFGIGFYTPALLRAPEPRQICIPLINRDRLGSSVTKASLAAISCQGEASSCDISAEADIRASPLGGE